MLPLSQLTSPVLQLGKVRIGSGHTSKRFVVAFAESDCSQRLESRYLLFSEIKACRTASWDCTAVCSVQFPPETHSDPTASLSTRRLSRQVGCHLAQHRSLASLLSVRERQSEAQLADKPSTSQSNFRSAALQVLKRSLAPAGALLSRVP